AQGTASTTPLAEVTQVMRLPPGDVNLARLCKVDRIADEVIAGTLDIEDGFRQLQSLTTPPPRWWWPASVAAFGIAAAMVAVLLRGSWFDLLAAGLIGVVIGQVTVSSASRPRLAVASEAIAALLATLIAGAISAFIVPLAIKT
ncbi:membrane protein containing DUF1212, partial [mine drainage metagenome]